MNEQKTAKRNYSYHLAFLRPASHKCKGRNWSYRMPSPSAPQYLFHSESKNCYIDTQETWLPFAPIPVMDPRTLLKKKRTERKPKVRKPLPTLPACNTYHPFRERERNDTMPCGSKTLAVSEVCFRFLPYIPWYRKRKQRRVVLRAQSETDSRLVRFVQDAATRFGVREAPCAAKVQLAVCQAPNVRRRTRRLSYDKRASHDNIGVTRSQVPCRWRLAQEGCVEYTGSEVAAVLAVQS